MRIRGKGLRPVSPDLRTSSISAQLLKDLLAARHTDDLFIPECKDGPTQGHEHLRLDAWAMARSWSRPCVSGYEIKVSRSDFNKDQKWHHYLPYCNLFYFVCPSELIRPEELPPEVGLLWASKTGARLFEKKKANYRTVTIPESLYRYILMCRVKVAKKYESRDQDNAAYWRAWLQREKKDQELGHMVSRTLRKLVSEKITAAEAEVRNTRAQIEQYESLITFLKEAGFTSDGKVYACYVRRQMQEHRLVVPPHIPRVLDNAIDELERLRTQIQELQKNEVPGNMTK